MSGLGGRAREVSLIAFWLTEVWFSRWSLREVPLCAFWEGIRTLVLCTVLSIVLCTGGSCSPPWAVHSSRRASWRCMKRCTSMWTTANVRFSCVSSLFSQLWESYLRSSTFPRNKTRLGTTGVPYPGRALPVGPRRGMDLASLPCSWLPFYKKKLLVHQNLLSIQLSGVGRWLAEHNIYLPPPPTP